MKRPDLERLRYLSRVARRREKREWKRKFHRRHRHLLARSKPEKAISQKTFRVRAPREFDVRVWENRNALFQLLSHLANLMEQGAAGVRIEFDDTTLLHPAGTLFFVATIEHLITKYPGRVTSNYPKDNVVEQLFQHIGLLQKLGNPARVEVTAENVRHWHYVEGITADLSGLKRLFAILKDQLPEDTSSGLFDSISEAVTNVVQHAYDGEPEEGTADARWWLFAQVQEGSLHLAICDLGIGIPRSLQQKPELSTMLPMLLRLMRKRVASGLIEIAVESNRSRTRLPHRGKGLPEMLRFSKRGVVGGFFIMSHNGVFLYNSSFQTETARDFEPPLTGTLITWMIPLPQGELTL